MNNEQLWRAALGELELIISKANFTAWFKNTFIAKKENGTAVVAVPNTFTKTWLENKYHQAIYKALRNITNGEIKEIVYRVEVKKTATVTKPNRIITYQALESLQNNKQISDSSVNNKAREEVNRELNPRYTFDNFIVGKTNELAYAAAQAVTEKPGKAYNPLFIYGGVGLGKTHLLQAIGNGVIKNHPGKKVLYITCERFTNDFVQAVKLSELEKFKAYYRSVDILLVDDIHFIAGKEQTQEQFFHTFNELYQNNKHIIITSDRPPKAIPTLEKRLSSRFEWGMVADITQPDLETRVAILETKLSERKFSLNSELITYIASCIQSNVRELEGVLNKIIAHHELQGIEPTKDSVKQIISSLSKRLHTGTITVKQIIKTVTDFYETSIEDVLSTSRKKKLVIPRQIIMYLMREETKASFPNIGLELGGRDHTTAMHAYIKISKEIETNERLRHEIDLIRQRLYNLI